MPRLTRSQLLILSAAALRADGAVLPPPNLRGRALKRALVPLLKQGYLREEKVARKAPSWRLDRAKGRVALLLTPEGREAVGAQGGGRGRRRPSADSGQTSDHGANRRVQRRRRPRAIPAPAVSRRSTKLALVVRLINRRSGATLDDLAKATGWLPHSIRAALSSLRKRGHVIERTRDRRDRPVYRLIASSRKDQVGPKTRKRAPPLRRDGHRATSRVRNVRGS
jgi:hypothetical protein